MNTLDQINTIKNELAPTSITHINSPRGIDIQPTDERQIKRVKAMLSKNNVTYTVDNNDRFIVKA